MQVEQKDREIEQTGQVEVEESECILSFYLCGNISSHKRILS